MLKATALLRLGAVSSLAALAACVAPESPAESNDENVGSAAEAVVYPDPTQLFQWSTQDKITGFAHSADIYATETFKAGTSQALQTITMPAVTYQYGGATRTVDDYMVRNKVSGLLIMKNGKIALERYANGTNQYTLWQSFSIAKSVVSTLVGIAIKNNQIGSLDDTIETYVPEVVGSAYQGVTLRNLLRMTSGVDWKESEYEDPTSDANYSIAYCLGNRIPNCTLNRLLTKQRVAPQGTVWHYNTGEAFLVGLALQRATGKTLAGYLESKLWKPAKMERDGVWVRESNNGVSYGGVGFNATLRDYGRFAQFIMNNGVLPGGTPLLPTDWVKDATTWVAPSAYPGFADNGQYGYMWWFYPAYDDGINNPSPLMTNTGPVPLQNTTAPTSIMLTNRTSDWTFSGYGIYGQLMSINQIEKVIVIEWSTWDLADPVDLTVTPQNPYNEEGVFVNAVINALH